MQPVTCSSLRTVPNSTLANAFFCSYIPTLLNIILFLNKSKDGLRPKLMIYLHNIFQQGIHITYEKPIQSKA